MRGVYFVYLKVQQQGEILARKPRYPTGNASVWRFAADWRILSARNPRQLACSFCKWLQVEHSSWGYPGFRARIRHSTCTKRSRKTFASYVPDLGKGMLGQSHLPGLSPLSLAPSVCWKSQDSLGWVANRKAVSRMSKPISGRPSLWGLLPRIAKEPGALPGSWIHGGRYKI